LHGVSVCSSDPQLIRPAIIATAKILISRNFFISASKNSKIKSTIFY